MEQNKLQEILGKHRDWLLNLPGGEKANLQGVDLSRANLWGAILWRANLQEANFEEANLREANLWGTNLRGTNLQGTNLCGANLFGADLSLADLRGAKLRGAELNVKKADEIKGVNITIIDNLGKHHVVKHEDTVYIGCCKHSLDHWLKNYKAIGKKHSYTETEIETYGKVLRGL